MIDPITWLKLVEQIQRDEIQIKAQSTLSQSELLNGLATLVNGAITDISTMPITGGARMDPGIAAAARDKVSGAIAMGKLILDARTVIPR